MYKRQVKAYLGGDLGDAFVSGAQQRTGRFQPTIGQIVHEGHTGLPFEFAAEIRFIEGKLLGQGLGGDGAGEVFVDIIQHLRKAVVRQGGIVRIALKAAVQDLQDSENGGFNSEFVGETPVEEFLGNVQDARCV